MLSYGIHGNVVTDSIFQENICESTREGISIAWSGSNVTIIDNICNNNEWSGITVMFSNRFGVSNTVMIANNTCNNNRDGIRTFSSNNISIINNNCSFNRNGIDITQSNSINITKNHLFNNSNGIYFLDSSNSSVTFNHIQFSYYYAIEMDTSSKRNSLHHNNFYFNSLHYPSRKQAYDSAQNNWFDITTAEEGNYWSDLIWFPGVTYELDGGNNIDPYPLANPVDIFC